MKIIKSWLLGVMLLIAGCYSKEFKEPGVRDLENYPTERQLSSSYNSTWNGLLALLKDVPILLAKKESGQLMTDWVVSKSDRLYSGYDDTHIPLKIRYRLTVTVRPLNEGTTVKVVNQEQYYTDSITTGGEMSGSLYKWVDTQSSTIKEKNLLDNLESYLSKNPTTPNN